jgi:hypothetical protein
MTAAMPRATTTHEGIAIDDAQSAAVRVRVHGPGDARVEVAEDAPRNFDDAARDGNNGSGFD